MGTKVDEESIPDEEYSDTLEQAMKNPNIDIPPEDDYMRNIDKIIKEFKSEVYQKKEKRKQQQHLLNLKSRNSKENKNMFF